jgi:putative addiction module component (TIGR02574 family)
VGHAGEDDLLVPKGRYQLQLSTQRGNIALQGGDLAVGETLSALQAGDVRLIDHGYVRDLGLCLAGRLAQSSDREMDSPLRAQPTAENPHRFRVTLRGHVQVWARTHAAVNPGQPRLGSCARPDARPARRPHPRTRVLAYTWRMTKMELRSQALQLPVEDRLELAEALWESLEQEPVQPELPGWQREVLDERLAADEAEPDAGSPWEEVKQRILAKL